MKGINVTLPDDNHEKLGQIKDALGKTNLSDTISEMIRRFPLSRPDNVKRAIFSEEKETLKNDA